MIIPPFSAAPPDAVIGDCWHRYYVRMLEVVESIKLIEQGWMDAIRHLHPGDAAMYTYWDFFRKRWERNAGLRIDHLLLNAAAQKRLKAADVDRAPRGREKPSDHTPVWVELA